MYCSHCGAELNKEDRFCGSCGHPIEANSSVMVAATVEQSILDQAQKKAINPKMKKWYILSGVVVAFLLIVYFVAQSFNGPSTPEELQKKFVDGLNKKDMSEIKSLVSKDSQALTSSESLELFKNSLDAEVVSIYTNELDREINNIKFNGKLTDQMNWFRIKKESSWLGDSYKIKVADLTLELEKMPTSQVDLSIGKTKFNKDGKITNLWPSNYTFRGKISNDFASEDVSSMVELNQLLLDMAATDKMIYRVNLSPLVENQLNIEIPNYFTEPVILINEKPVKLTGERTIVVPAPQKMTLEVKGKVLGVPVNEKKEIELNQENWTLKLIQSAIAKKSLDLLYEAADTWTKANNSKNPSEMKGINPNSDFYKMLSDDIKQNADSTSKYQLQKVVVNPDAVSVEENGIVINVAEYYLMDGYDYIASWDYRLKQVPGKAEWWIEDGSTSFYPVYDSTGEYTKVTEKKN